MAYRSLLAREPVPRQELAKLGLGDLAPETSSFNRKIALSHWSVLDFWRAELDRYAGHAGG